MCSGGWGRFETSIEGRQSGGNKLNPVGIGSSNQQIFEISRYKKVV